MLPVVTAEHYLTEKDLMSGPYYQAKNLTKFLKSMEKGSTLILLVGLTKFYSLSQCLVHA